MLLKPIWWNEYTHAKHMYLVTIKSGFTTVKIFTLTFIPEAIRYVLGNKIHIFLLLQRFICTQP